MAFKILSISLFITNIICIVAEPHASTENTQNEAIVSAELSKSNGLLPRKMEYAIQVSDTSAEYENNTKGEKNKLKGDENNMKDVLIETITIDKNDENALKDFVINNRDQILEILQEHGETNKEAVDIDNFNGDDVKGESKETDDTVKMTTKKEESKEDNSPGAEQYRAEIKAGNRAEGFGTNPHYYQPHAFTNLFRRRYSSRKHNKKANPSPEENGDTHLEPKLASPEFVLDIAKKSALFEASKPKNPMNVKLETDILRSGNYWNSVWKEDADPNNYLRSLPTKPSSSLGIVRTQISPGSKLYELIKKLSGISPRLIYVINKKSDF